MVKIAFIFPGQGAQYIGMAMDFIEQNPEYEAILKNFDEIGRASCRERV